MPFWNPNGIFQKKWVFGAEIHIYRSGCKKSQISKIKLEMESMDPGRSKTGLRMFLRCLDQFLKWDKYPIGFGKNRKN